MVVQYLPPRSLKLESSPSQASNQKVQICQQGVICKVEAEWVPLEIVEDGIREPVRCVKALAIEVCETDRANRPGVTLLQSTPYLAHPGTAGKVF